MNKCTFMYSSDGFVWVLQGGVHCQRCKYLSHAMAEGVRVQQPAPAAASTSAVSHCPLGSERQEQHQLSGRRSVPATAAEGGTQLTSPTCPLYCIECTYLCVAVVPRYVSGLWICYAPSLQSLFVSGHLHFSVEVHNQCVGEDGRDPRLVHEMVQTLSFRPISGSEKCT